MAPPTLPLDKSNFTLDASSVAGVFGGDEAVSAMATVHVYKRRRWLGWYNCPGSYQIARKYGLLTQSKFFDGFFPGLHTDPATLFEFDGWKGPKFRAAHSGTIIEDTGHLASLVIKESSTLKGQVVEGRKTQPVGVTVMDLEHVPELEISPEPINVHSPFYASIPIGVSVGGCVVSGIFGDWYSFSMILLGILANGISCLVIGSGHLVFTHPRPAEGCPPGDGILSSSKEIVLLKGPEGAVNSITRGKFSLNYSEAMYEIIGCCSVFLIVQFVAQLLLIPQGSLLGQIMFVASLGVSWMYNCWLSSLDKEEIQRHIFFKSVLRNQPPTKYLLGTRTTMVVFVLLVLQPEKPSKILEELLPNDTNVWKIWKKTLLRRLPDKEKLEFNDADWELDELDEKERTLLKTLYGDTQAAYEGYVKHVAVD